MKIQLSEHFGYRKLIRFTVPTILMMLFTSIYGIVDGIFISQVEGDTAFSAVNLMMPFLMVLGSFGFMVGTGGSALISKTLGEGKKEKANEIFSMLIILQFVMGAIFTFGAMFFTKDIAILLGANEQMLPYCDVYCKTLLYSITFFLLQNSFQSFLIVEEKPKFGLYVTLFAGVTNMILDFLFVFVFRLGVLGAGLATGISQFVGSIIPLVYYIKGKNTLLKLVKTKFNFSIILNTCANGASEMLGSVSFNLVNMLFNKQLMTMIGQDGVSAYGVIMYVGFIFVGIYIGYSAGVMPILGFHYGAKNRLELKNLFVRSLKLLATSSLISIVFSHLLARQLASVFVGKNQQLLELSTLAFRLHSLAYLISWLNHFASSLFTALNNGLISGVISFLRTLVFQVLAIYIIPLIIKPNGIWLAVIFAETLALIVSLTFILTNKKRYGYL